MLHKYKVGDRVLIRKDRGNGWNSDGEMDKYCNTVMTIRELVGSSLYSMEEDKYDGNGNGWYWDDTDIVKKVEEEKMFTKNDIKNGMFGVMTNGCKFVVVGNTIVYDDGDFDEINLKFAEYEIDKLYENCRSFKQLNNALFTKIYSAKLVYDRARDTKPLYNGKVVCIDNINNPTLYTNGKIYQFNDGFMTANNGDKYPDDPVHSFEEWSEWTGSKFIEIKE